MHVTTHTPQQPSTPQPAGLGRRARTTLVHECRVHGGCHGVACAGKAVNALTAEAMLAITSILRLGESAALPIPLDDDSKDRMLACLSVLAKPDDQATQVRQARRGAAPRRQRRLRALAGALSASLFACFGGGGSRRVLGAGVQLGVSTRDALACARAAPPIPTHTRTTGVAGELPRRLQPADAREAGARRRRGQEAGRQGRLAARRPHRLRAAQEPQGAHADRD